MREFTYPLTLLLAVVCLATAAPYSDVHADPSPGTVVPAVGNVADSRIEATISTTTNDIIDSSTLEPDSPACVPPAPFCPSRPRHCKGRCVSDFSPLDVSIVLSLARTVEYN